MAKFVCSGCGTLASGEEAPLRCPSCGAKDQYRSTDLEPTTLEEVRGRARDKLKNICAVYPVCDGGPDRICQKENYGRPIGMGGIGLGRSFRNNFLALESLQLTTRLVGDSFEPSTEFDFFGRKFSMPIFGASTSGMSQYNGAITELDFCRATIRGCLDAGTLAWRGDTAFYRLDNHPGIESVEEAQGQGIPIFKPRRQVDLKVLIARAEACGSPAVGVDLDGAGSTNFARAGQPVYRKTPAEIQELVASTKLPFIVKGIMDPDDAQACADAGVAVIVVSNHGGRVLDSTPGTAEVLPLVVERVGHRVAVFADGGIRNGGDVLKMLALGAKAVLIGRDVIRAAIGGGEIGVSLQMRHLHKTLKQAMVMTGCRDLASIGSHLLAKA
jgi:hypothetical protein